MTKEEAIELVINDAIALEHLDARFKNDKKVVLADVTNDEGYITQNMCLNAMDVEKFKNIMI